MRHAWFDMRVHARELNLPLVHTPNLLILPMRQHVPQRHDLFASALPRARM